MIGKCWETGLHYNWHRSYDPSLGRYTQADPLGFPDGPSRYAYAVNSPQVYVDKDGRTVFYIYFSGGFISGVGAGGGFGFAIDHNLNFDSFYTGSAGTGLDVGFNMSLGVGSGTICDFSGESMSTSVEAGPGVTFGGGAFVGKGGGSRGGFLTVGVGPIPVGANLSNNWTRLGSGNSYNACSCAR